MQDPDRGRAKRPFVMAPTESTHGDEETASPQIAEGPNPSEVDDMGRGYLEMERHASLATETSLNPDILRGTTPTPKRLSQRSRDEAAGRVVDVVLSDMCAPWPQTTGYSVQSVSDPYYRMMNASGIGVKDHAGSMVRGPFPSDCHTEIEKLTYRYLESLHGRFDIRI